MKRVLDTNAILYLLGGKLAQILPAGEYFISVISEVELLSYPLLDESARAQIQKFLSEITIVDLTDEVKALAIRLRRQHLLKLPDAIVAATALSLGAVFITNDERLLQLPEPSSQAVRLRSDD